jgi:hypothetical protein
VLEVRPTEGVMLNTTFLMIASDWSDEDLPLSYQFGYVASSSLSLPSDLIVLRSKMQLPYASTVLPNGNSDLQRTSQPLDYNTPSNLSCAVMVFDQLSSSSRSLFHVSVREVSMDSDDLRVFLQNGLDVSQATKNPEDFKNTLSLTATVLNRINCSEAPDCELLNRLACSSISNEGTCGECLPRFVGLLGSSNTPCVSLSEASRRRVTSSPAVSCDSDVHCAKEGLFFECNLQSKRCQSIQQSCPNSCSGHGRCVFVSKYNADVSVSECGVLDVDCVAHCACDTGYVGSFCALTVEELSKAMEIRHLIVESVGELMSLENSWNTNIKSWMRQLLLVGSDYSSLSVETKRVMAALTIHILKVSREAGLSVEEMSESGMDKVVDMCVSGFIATSPLDASDELSQLSSLLTAYTAFATSDMLEAQDSVSSITPSFRSSSFFLSSSSSASSILSIPETGLESLTGSQQQSINLPSGFIFPFQISLTETITQSTVIARPTNQSNTTLTESTLSLPLFVSLKLRAPTACVIGDDCLMRVTLRHKLQYKDTISSPQSRITSFTSNPTPNLTYFEVDCVAGVIENRSFVCDSGDVIVISCNGSSLRGRRLCPERLKSIDCQTRVQSSASNVSDISCQLSGHNESMTVCVCNLSEVRAGVRDEGLVSFSILSIERSVLREFVSTWESVPSLSSGNVTGSWVVLVTVGSLGVVFVLMIVLSIYYDSQTTKLLSSGKVVDHHPSNDETCLDIISPRDSESNEANEDLQLIEGSLPAIFKANSLWTKFKEEMRVYHRWLGIVLHYSPEFPRSMRVLSLFSSIVIMLFVQSVTYSIADPDDGSCEACQSESRCMSLRSTLNLRQSRCYWEPAVSSEGEESGSCHFREIGEDMTRMFIVAMISAIVSAPFALSVQYLIVKVLSKETMSPEEEKRERENSKALKLRRMLSTRKMSIDPDVSMTDLVESCGRSTQDDLNHLLKEVSAYYKYLQKQKNEQAREFRGMSTRPPSLSFCLFWC